MVFTALDLLQSVEKLRELQVFKRGGFWSCACHPTMMIYVVVAPTFVGVSKALNEKCPIWGSDPFRYPPPRCNRSRSACSTKSQTSWEQLAGYGTHTS